MPGHVHLHTRFSDGEITPEMVASLRPDFIAVTDHDDVRGYESFVPLESEGIEVILGVELSVAFKGRAFHVLNLWPGPCPFFFEILGVLQARRRKKAEIAADRLESMGFDTAGIEEVLGRFVTKRKLCDFLLSRPENGRILAGYAATDLKSMKRRIFTDAGIDVHPEGLDAREVLPKLKGAVILAHPGTSLRLPEELGLARALLGAAPFNGIETLTRGHKPEDSLHAGILAEEFGLVPVAGNDVHKFEHLHANQTPDSVLAELKARRIA